MNVLPIDPLLPEVVSSLRARRDLVLVAPPGAGKTTRVPPAILGAGLLAREHPALVLLQPRRVAAGPRRRGSPRRGAGPSARRSATTSGSSAGSARGPSCAW
jgi:ATP-dependent helicase HrpB